MLIGLLLLTANIEVGPTRTLTLPSQAAAMANDGDTILIDAGLYPGDAAIWRANNLTIRGVGGRAHLRADGAAAQGKAIWVITGQNTTVESIEFSGATVPDMNGAGIRQEGPNLIVRDCYFHDNEDGILTGENLNSDILVESSIFDHNGAGDGFSHNMYIGHVRSFTLRGSYTHDARVGHLIKSRANLSIIEGNRITEEAGADASMEAEFPNGGTVIVVGNFIVQGPNSQNSGIISFGSEGSTNPNEGLFVAYNTVVNSLGRGTIVNNRGTAPAVVVDNIFYGGGTVLGGPGTPASNLVSATPGFVDVANLDVHLLASSAAIGAAVDPGMGGGRSLIPTIEYVHPARSTPRGSGLDQGCFEHTTVPGDAGVSPDAGFPSPSDAGVPPADAGSPTNDAAPLPDAMSAVDAGQPAADAGEPAPDAGADAGLPAPDADLSPDSGTPLADSGLVPAMDGAVRADSGQSSTTGRATGGCGCETSEPIQGLLAAALLGLSWLFSPGRRRP